MDGLKGTDYLLAIGIAMYVIKELFALIKSKNEKLQEQQSAPPEIVRVNDESELLYRQNMMTQHEKMTEAINATLAISKSTNDKTEKIKNDMIIVKDRVVNK